MKEKLRNSTLAGGGADVDKTYCTSSYLAFRFIEDDSKNFYKGLTHENIKPLPDSEKILVHNSEDIGQEISRQIDGFRDLKKGVLLSGGMDSAIVASYLSGSDAYTFRFMGGSFQGEELARAEYFAKIYGLRLHYVDISWETVTNYLDTVMKAKGAPVHSIEPQIYQAALQAKSDGVEIMFSGASSDLIFGGMDKLLSRNWDFDSFMNRYIFTKPEEVLNEPESMQYLFEHYRLDDNKIDFLAFLNEISLTELLTSYATTFKTAGLLYCDPYVVLKPSEPLDLTRIRNGESKYLIRKLFRMRYPDIQVPEKIPMPRPVDIYFKDWNGPSRKEFKADLNMKNFTGNQKWQIYCLERFMNLYE